MFLLGLTGNIACGKSTVAQMLVERGAARLDADLLVRELYADPKFARRVAALFPQHCARLLTPEGEVNRRALGEIVFCDGAALEKLEALTHPAVIVLQEEKLRELAARKPAPSLVVVEAVKLIESGQDARFDAIWCVICEPQMQLGRLMQTRGLSEDEARRRLEHQPDLESKRRRIEESTAARSSTPFIIIANDFGRDELERTIEKQWKALSFKKQT